MFFIEFHWIVEGRGSQLAAVRAPELVTLPRAGAVEPGIQRRVHVAVGLARCWNENQSSSSSWPILDWQVAAARGEGCLAGLIAGRILYNISRVILYIAGKFPSGVPS